MKTHSSSQATYIDDEASPSVAKTWYSFPTTKEYSGEVGIDGLAPLIHIHIANRTEDTQSGIVDQDVESAEAFINEFE